MSHYSIIKTTFVSKNHLREALKDVAEEFGLINLREFGLIRRGNGSASSADLVASTANRGYDVGFVRGDKGYNLVADWHGITDIDRKSFASRLAQRYAYHAVRKSLGEQGFVLIDEELDEKKTIHLRMRRVGGPAPSRGVEMGEGRPGHGWKDLPVGRRVGPAQASS